MDDSITMIDGLRVIMNSKDSISALVRTARRQYETDEAYKQRMESLLTRSDDNINLSKRKAVLNAIDSQIDGPLFH